MQKGKPPEPMTRKLISAPDRLWAAIADYRFSQRIGTEAEAIRQLLQSALDAAATGRQPARKAQRKER
jgi:hypothetical protein